MKPRQALESAWGKHYSKAGVLLRFQPQRAKWPGSLCWLTLLRLHPMEPLGAGDRQRTGEAASGARAGPGPQA